MNHFSIELPSRFQDSRSGDLLAADDKPPLNSARVRTGRAAWPFLVGASRLPDGDQPRVALSGEHSFSS